MLMVATGLVGGDMAFNPVQNELYVWGYDSNLVTVYDTTTFVQKRTMNVGDNLWFYNNPPGALSVMTTSPDGKTLFLETSSGVRELNVSSDPPPVPSITVSRNSITRNDPVTLTAQVSTGGGIWSGTVLFKDGDQVLGSAALDGNGLATYTTSALPVGNNSITALFQSDNGKNAASLPVNVTVNRPTPMMTLTQAQIGLPTLPPVMNVTVSGIGVAATGNVDLYEGNTLLGTGTLNGGHVQITPARCWVWACMR